MVYCCCWFGSRICTLSISCGNCCNTHTHNVRTNEMCVSGKRSRTKSKLYKHRRRHAYLVCASRRVRGLWCACVIDWILSDARVWWVVQDSTSSCSICIGWDINSELCDGRARYLFKYSDMRFVPTLRAYYAEFILTLYIEQVYTHLICI